MSRISAVSLATLILVACSRKEEVVVAAPVSPPARTAGAPSGQPAVGQDAALPPGHPSLDQMEPPGAPGGQEPGTAAPPMPAHGAAMSSGDVGQVKVEKAKGPEARTVAEVVRQRAALKDRTVVIHGKVVRYTPGVMGKNWIHLRDGTGTAGKDDDVTVTTQDTAAKGEVITVRGKVALDQNIGMGASYPLIVQDAKVTR
jgi:hypothetical protein